MSGFVDASPLIPKAFRWTSARTACLPSSTVLAPVPRLVARLAACATSHTVSVNKSNFRWRFASSRYDRLKLLIAIIYHNETVPIKMKTLQLNRIVNWHYFVIGKQPVRLQHATASTYTRMYIELLLQSNLWLKVLTEIVSKLYLI